MIVFGNPLYGDTIARAAGATYNPGVDQCIAREEDGLLVGGATYANYTGASIGMHMAGFTPTWINKDLLWACFHYPFVQLGCRKVFGQVPETNKRALDLDLKFGFKIVARIDDVFPDGACIVVALAREDCRWLKIRPRSIASGSEK